MLVLSNEDSEGWVRVARLPNTTTTSTATSRRAPARTAPTSTTPVAAVRAATTATTGGVANASGSANGLMLVGAAVQSYFGPENRSLCESVATLAFAQNGNPEYLVAWEKGKVLHHLYQKFRDGGGGVGVGGSQLGAKDQCVAACRSETQQAIALFVKQHPTASAATVQKMVKDELVKFQTKIAPLYQKRGRRTSGRSSSGGGGGGGRHGPKRGATVAARKPGRKFGVGFREPTQPSPRPFVPTDFNNDPYLADKLTTQPKSPPPTVVARSKTPVATPEPSAHAPNAGPPPSSAATTTAMASATTSSPAVPPARARPRSSKGPRKQRSLPTVPPPPAEGDSVPVRPARQTSSGNAMSASTSDDELPPLSQDLGATKAHELE
jgi:hypothetical protein